MIQTKKIWPTIFLLTFIYGCCSMPGQSGTDCTMEAEKYGLYLSLDLDSTQNGFTLAESDSTYVIKFNNDSLTPFTNAIDTIRYYSEYFKYNYSRRDFSYIDISKKDSYEVKYSYIVKNKYTQNELRISNIKMEIVTNDSKCCYNYTGQQPKSYLLNGVLIEGESEVILHKK